MKRRDILQGLALSAMMFGNGGRASVKDVPRLTIGELEIFRVRVNRRGNWTIARLQTSGGISGLGDASHGYGDATHGTNDDATLGYLKQFSTLLRGMSIFDFERFRQTAAASNTRGGTPACIALNALEQCIWDIRGKAFSVPTYDLFGGRLQDRIRLYANINRSTDDRSPKGFSDMAQNAVQAGFDAVKLAPFDEIRFNAMDPAELERRTKFGIACAQAVRDTIGARRDLMIDGHSRFTVEQGLRLASALEPLHLYWLEEVTPADPISNLAAVHHAVRMQTAGGESLVGVKGFYPYVKGEAVDIVMPDVKVCGGMMEMKKIAGLAEGAGLLTSPHGPASPVGNVTAAHVIASVPNFNILEFSYGEVPWRAELITPPEEIDMGALVISNRPGLGIALNEKTAAKYAV